MHYTKRLLELGVGCKQHTPELTTALYNDSKRKDTVSYGPTRSESRLLGPLVPQQVISDMYQKDVGENLARYTEQCDALVIATVPSIPFPLPERDDHTPQQIRGNSLPYGSQDNMQAPSHRFSSNL
ncbi:uncharacterized protein [Penaeus vannamei]|uniref:uncharacterized protein n=1 Tax=Penaeus vannamei TaxID=6689 RepID=UPI00387F4DF9